MANANLTNAKKAKNDEFYTQVRRYPKKSRLISNTTATPFEAKSYIATAMIRLRATFSNILRSI